MFSQWRRIGATGASLGLAGVAYVWAAPQTAHAQAAAASTAPHAAAPFAATPCPTPATASPPLFAATAAGALRSGAPMSGLMLAPREAAKSAAAADRDGTAGGDATQTEFQQEVARFAAFSMTEREATKCEEWKQRAIHKSRKVNYMLRAMKRLGCNVDPFDLIACIGCSSLASGGTALSEESVNIFMCGNGLKSWDQFETVLTHELIHAYDHCRAEVDPANVEHHACLEVRAANLSGDCSFKREALRGELDIGAHQPKCVKRRAIMSILANPGIESVEHARKVVDSIYDRCAADTEPFGSVPW